MRRSYLLNNGASGKELDIAATSVVSIWHFRANLDALYRNMYRIPRFIWLLAASGRPDIRRVGSIVSALRISDGRAQMRLLARGGTVRSGPIVGNLPTAVDFRGAVFRPCELTWAYFHPRAEQWSGAFSARCDTGFRYTPRPEKSATALRLGRQ